MPETFPTTPRAPTAVRVGAIVIGLAALLLATRTTITSSRWVGRVFPGFLLLDNRVVASIGLAHWSGTSVPDLYQSEVVAVDGAARRLAPRGLRARRRRSPPARPCATASAAPAVEREVTIATQRFAARDWILLFGAYLLNGAVFLACGPRGLGPAPARAAVARAPRVGGIACGVFLLTAMDLYGPATFFRLHVVGESLLPAAGLPPRAALPAAASLCALALRSATPIVCSSLLVPTSCSSTTRPSTRRS